MQNQVRYEHFGATTQLCVPVAAGVLVHRGCNLAGTQRVKRCAFLKLTSRCKIHLSSCVVVMINNNAPEGEPGGDMY